MNLDLGHGRDAKRRIGVVVALLDRAVGAQGQFLGQDGAQAEAGAALDLCLDHVRVDHGAAIDRGDHPVHLHLAALDRDLGDMGDVGVEAFVHGQAQEPALGQGFAPSGLFRRQLENRRMARMIL